ncbi:hypothetical protein ACIQVT_20370 [Streptomyces sp. NPDC100445]|uniref:hypothetical protein n=1 Tax=Streptomyces sp. NPDC100445 TaxID=3366102 RepID=UPI003811CFCD
MSGARHRPRLAVTALLRRAGPRTLRGRPSLVAVTTATPVALGLTAAFDVVAQ